MISEICLGTDCRTIHIFSVNKLFNDIASLSNYQNTANCLHLSDPLIKSLILDISKSLDVNANKKAEIMHKNEAVTT